MQGGANIRISPSWVPGTTIVDISWDTVVLNASPVPQGPWAGDFALFGGFGSTPGQYDWHKNTSELELWVPNPAFLLQRVLVGTLSGFSLPALNGTSGAGTLAPTIAPVSGVLFFVWEVAALV